MCRPVRLPARLPVRLAVRPAGSAGGCPACGAAAGGRRAGRRRLLLLLALRGCAQQGRGEQGGESEQCGAGHGILVDGVEKRRRSTDCGLPVVPTVAPVAPAAIAPSAIAPAAVAPAAVAPTAIAPPGKPRRGIDGDERLAVGGVLLERAGNVAADRLQAILHRIRGPSQAGRSWPTHRRRPGSSTDRRRLKAAAWRGYAAFDGARP